MYGMVYSPIFTIKNNQIKVDILYMVPMGIRESIYRENFMYPTVKEAQ